MLLVVFVDGKNVLVVLVDGKNVATAQEKVLTPSYDVHAVGRGADAGVARRCGRAAAPTVRRAGAPPAAMLGMGAVVMLDSTEMLVLGDLLVLAHEEGILMPQEGEENHFMLLVRRIGPLSAHLWAQNGHS